jgi:hypothetical protein
METLRIHTAWHRRALGHRHANIRHLMTQRSPVVTICAQALRNSQRVVQLLRGTPDAWRVRTSGTGFDSVRFASATSQVSAELWLLMTSID